MTVTKKKKIQEMTKKSKVTQKSLSGQNIKRHQSSGHNKPNKSIIGRNPFTLFASGLFNTSTTVKKDMEVLDIPSRQFWKNPDVLSPEDLRSGGGVSMGGGAGNTSRVSPVLPSPHTIEHPQKNILEPTLDIVLDEIIKGRGSAGISPADRRAIFMQLLKEMNVPGQKEELENLNKEGIETMNQLGAKRQALQPLRIRIPGNLGDVRFRGDIRLPRTTRHKWYEIIQKMKRPPTNEWDIGRTPPDAGGPEQKKCLIKIDEETYIDICKSRIIRMHAKI